MQIQEQDGKSPVGSHRAVLSRRAILSLSTSLVLGALFTRSKLPDFASLAIAQALGGAVSPRAMIDIHGHIFNAEDVPVEGFLVDVVGSGGFWARAADTVGFVSLLRWVLVGPGKLYQVEFDELTKLAADPRGLDAVVIDPNEESGYLDRRIRSLIPFFGDSTESDEEAHNKFVGVAAKYFATPLSPFAGVAPMSALKAVRDVDPEEPLYRSEALRTVYERYTANHKKLFERREKEFREGLAPFAAGGGRPSPEQVQKARKLAQSMDADIAGLGPQIALAQTEEDSLLTWAAQFHRYRFELAKKLCSAIKGVPDRPRLYAVSLVDYQWWLGSQERVKVHLQDQAELVTRLAKLPPNGKLFHGFYGYDPLRAIVEEVNGVEPKSRALEIAKRKVKDLGFLGVKLYPPMGFMAIGNASLDDDQFGERVEKLIAGFGGVKGIGKGVGARLDHHLSELYKWCLAEDVPILVHCSPSQYAFEDGRHRASPAHWEKLLGPANAPSEFGKLRLNLGHFGGVWCLGKTTTKVLTGNACGTVKAEEALEVLEKTWSGKVVAMLAAASNGAYPNLFADLGDFGSVSSPALDEQGIWAAAYTNLKTLLRAHKGASSRMLYGTDWSMLGKERGHSNYYLWMLHRMNELRAELPELGANFIDGYFWRNSARYLGLIGDKASEVPATRKRLNEFHKSNDQALALLKSFDALAWGT